MSTNLRERGPELLPNSVIDNRYPISYSSSVMAMEQTPVTPGPYGPHCTCSSRPQTLEQMMAHEPCERCALYEAYSDLYKDRNGVRPRFASTYSVQQLKAAIDRLPPLSADDLSMPE